MEDIYYANDEIEKDENIGSGKKGRLDDMELTMRGRGLLFRFPLRPRLIHCVKR